MINVYWIAETRNLRVESRPVEDPSADAHVHLEQAIPEGHRVTDMVARHDESARLVVLTPDEMFLTVSSMDLFTGKVRDHGTAILKSECISVWGATEKRIYMVLKEALYVFDHNLEWKANVSIPRGDHHTLTVYPELLVDGEVVEYECFTKKKKHYQAPMLIRRFDPERESMLCAVRHADHHPEPLVDDFDFGKQEAWHSNHRMLMVAATRSMADEIKDNTGLTGDELFNAIMEQIKARVMEADASLQEEFGKEAVADPDGDEESMRMITDCVREFVYGETGPDKDQDEV